jgi:hypothetical protein
VHLEHGVHHPLGSLLDLFLRLIRHVFPSRSSRLRGAKEFHRKDAKSAKKDDEVAHHPLTIRLMPSLISRFEQARPQCAAQLENGVHRLLGGLLDLFLRLIHHLFPSRSSRLRGAKEFHRKVAKSAKKGDELTHKLLIII